MIAAKSRITDVEVTVVQKVNIAISRNQAVYRFRESVRPLAESFFVTFLDKQKSK